MCGRRPAHRTLARDSVFSVHEGIGFLSIVNVLLWLLATSIALVVWRQQL
jgi:hypothetical protein